MRVRVSDIGSNFEENLQRWSRALGTGELKRKIFLTVYSNRKSRWSVPEIADVTALPTKTIASVGKQMCVKGLFEQVEGHRVVYQKIPEVHQYKRQILRLAGNSKARESLPTKRNMGSNGVTRMTKTTNNFNNVGVANTGSLSGSINGNSQSIQVNEEVRQLIAALDHFRNSVRGESSLLPEQREDAENAAADLESEIAKPMESRNVSRVRNAVSALKTLASGTEAVRKIYEQLHPFIAAHFHLPS